MTDPKSQPLKFAELSLSPALLQVVDELGYTELTPIQAQAIPPLLRGKDLVGQSKTGSGKTAAFALPILNALSPSGRRLEALILCPTRELCTQVAREIRKLGRRHPGLQVLVVSGGLPSGPQKAALEKGVHIVVGTPGRCLDLIDKRKLNLKGVSSVVLDEADRMLDMGFLEDIETILKQTPPSRQTVFFSATFPETIDTMSRAYQKSPVKVTVADKGDDAPAIRQWLCQTDRENKLATLKMLLAKHKPESSIVFCNHKATVSELADALNGDGISAAPLHGGLEQRDRDKVMAKFRNHSVRVLIATDVAARGLDIEALDIVFNFDLPQKPDVYVHRIGRTGRAGLTGLAISLVTRSDQRKVREIEEALGTTLELENAIAAPREPRPTEGPKAPVPHQAAAMETLYIGGGRKEKVRPGDILGALTGDAAGLAKEQIGKIEIHDHFAYVAVEKSVVNAALHGLRNGRIKGKKFQIELVK